MRKTLIARLARAACLASCLVGAVAVAAGPARSESLLDKVARCVSEKAQGNPTPGCDVVDPDPAKGYMIAKDLRGNTQYLLVAANKELSGIESPQLAGDIGTEFWPAAWAARNLVQACRKMRGLPPLADDEIGLAVNSPFGRSVDRLHIHIDQLDPEVVRQLRAGALSVKSAADHPYLVAVVDSIANPFAWLAERIRLADGAMMPMSRQTIVVAGGPAPGRFYILYDRADDTCVALRGAGDCGHGEELQIDHNKPADTVCQ